jgi:hypothetical protein
VGFIVGFIVGRELGFLGLMVGLRDMVGAGDMVGPGLGLIVGLLESRTPTQP